MELESAPKSGKRVIEAEGLSKAYGDLTVVDNLSFRVIRGDRIVAAGVQFPLADGDNLPQELGSRHRAAIGLSQEADALILIVSEETGRISIAEHGHIESDIAPQDVEITITETPRHNWGIRGLPGDELQLGYKINADDAE